MNTAITPPLTAVDAVAGLSCFSQLAVNTQAMAYWVVFCPEDGVNRLQCLRAGVVQSLTPDGLSVRSRVHEYGGLSWCLLDDERWVFVNAADQQLYVQSLDDLTPRQLTHTISSRFGEPHYHARDQRLIAIEEMHGEGAVINRLVAVCLQTGQVTVLHQSHDFYSSIALSEDGKACLFIAWDHPHQPWVCTQLYHARWTESGALTALKAYSPGVEASILQPQFDNQMGIWAISDHAGWWNLYQVSQAGDNWTPYAASAHDCTTAPWQFGGYHYQLEPNALVSLVLEDASAGLRRVTHGGDVTQLADAYCHFSYLTHAKGDYYAIAASATCASDVIKIDATTGAATVLASATPHWEAEALSSAQHIRFPVDDSEAHGFFYPAGDGASPPPLIVCFHGGPTSCTYPVLKPLIQLWTQQGFAVFDLNYRGSSGYGRAYRLALQHAWGTVDVADAHAAVDYLVQRQWVNPSQVFIRGGSAGGFTALAAITNSECFTAAASLYGVTDPWALTQETHKFESRYLDWLIGDPVADIARYRAIAPLHHVDGIATPVIFFQGEQDQVVVPDQTRHMVAALQAQGVTVEAHYYGDEAHGFRRANNLVDVIQKELAFYRRAMQANSDIEH